MVDQYLSLCDPKLFHNKETPANTEKTPQNSNLI